MYSDPTTSLGLRFKMHGHYCDYVHCKWIEQTYIHSIVGIWTVHGHVAVNDSSLGQL